MPAARPASALGCEGDTRSISCRENKTAESIVFLEAPAASSSSWAEKEPITILAKKTHRSKGRGRPPVHLRGGRPRGRSSRRASCRTAEAQRLRERWPSRRPSRPAWRRSRRSKAAAARRAEIRVPRVARSRWRTKGTAICERLRSNGRCRNGAACPFELIFERPRREAPSTRPNSRAPSQDPCATPDASGCSSRV